MCGRYALYGQKSRQPGEPLRFRGAVIDFAPRYNIPPMQDLPVYRLDAAQGPQLQLMRWGFVPAWSRQPGKGALLNNARAETAREKPAFREAWRRRRCLVPMNGFYEWQRSGTQKTPHYFSMADDEPFAVAGLWEHWPGAAATPAMTTFSILTTAASALMAPVHDRMPVIIAPEACDEWLDPRSSADRLEALMAPYAGLDLRVRRVGIRVNSVRHDDAALMEEAPASAILEPIPLQGQLL